MGWWITLGILFLLVIMPLGVSVKYDDAGPLVKILAGPVRIKVFPMKKKDKPPEKVPKKAEEKPGSEPAPKKEPPMTLPREEFPEKQGDKKEKKGGSVFDFVPLVKLAFRFLGDLRRKLRLNHLELKLILAGDDPCDLAVNYGRAWEALGNLMPRLEKWFVIKKRDLAVACDFTADETKIYARLDVSITLGRIITLAVGYGVRALKEFMKIQKMRKESKGGAAI